jgi:NAD+ synthase
LEKLPRQNPAFVVKVLSQFIEGEVQKYNFQGGVIALSGGLDSSVVAMLSHQALQGQIKLMYMPYENSRESYNDALSVAKLLGIPLEVFDLKKVADPFFIDRKPETRIRKGNILARLRMTALFDLSSQEQALVIGTSNKTEILVGYSTWFGDSAAGILPIGDLYKTQVRQIASFLSVPEGIIDKPPSAELWEGQTDEDEIGLTYDTLDQILFKLVDQRFTIAEVIAMGYSAEEVKKVDNLIRKSLYKQKTPLICKVSDRTVGIDYRYLKETSTIRD